MHRWIENGWRDVTYTCRGLLHAPAYTTWVVGSLAIGMAVTIGAFAVLIAALIGPFPEVTAQQRLVRVQVNRNCGRPDCWTRMSSTSDYDALRDGLTGLQGLTGYTQGQMAVGLPEARSMLGILATANYFDVLGVRPVAGRWFGPADADSKAAVAVISHTVWTHEFNADPAVIGRSIRVSDAFVQIIGVAPALFMGVDHRPGGHAPDLWLPIWLADGVLPPTAAEQRRQERLLDFVGRMKDTVDVSQIQAQADVAAGRLAAARSTDTSGGRAKVVRVYMTSPDNWTFAVIVILPIPILVLLLACVNATNLMLARGSRRQREIAVRVAIGASRGQIIRQLLVESGVLAILATAIAVALAWWGLQQASTPLSVPVRIDATVLLLTILTAGVTTVAFGLAPAVRVSAQRPSSMLGAGGSPDAPRQSRMRRGLVTAQLTLSVGLLATAWQLVSTVRSQSVSGGTPADHLLIARFDLQPLKPPPGAAEAFYRDLAAGAARLPGVEAAGVARSTAVWTFRERGTASLVAWEATDAPVDGRVTVGGYAGGDLFEAVGLRVLSGRGFTEEDRRTRPQVAIVNQTFAQNMKTPAVGSVIRVAPRSDDFDSALELRIVGVIEPVLEPRLSQDGPPAAKVYLPSPLEPEPAMALYLRTRGPATAVAQVVRELVGRTDPRVPILDIGSLQEFNERSFGSQLWLARGAALLGIVGLLLATAGLYGVSSYVVATRTREIAIRMALGASPGMVLRMLLGQSMRVAVTGLLLGGGLAVAVSRMIQAGYHGIQGFDGLAFGGAALLFLLTMLVASAIPATRASRVDPVEKLKNA